MSMHNSPFPSGTPIGSSDQLNFMKTEGSEVVDHTFQSIIPTPIRVTREQTSGNAVAVGATSKNSLQYSLSNLNIFQTLPKETIRGVDDFTRMKMSLVSGIPEETKWALKKYLTYSNKAPYMISLKNLPDLLPLFKKFILDLKQYVMKFNGPVVRDTESMNALQTGLNSLLIVRNLAQDTESLQIIVKDQEIKDFLLFELQIFEKICRSDKSFQLFETNSAYFNELIHYTLDLMEAVSSYIAPARKDDPYFQTLVSILKYTKDRAMVISILRSLSRLLVRSKADEESAADNLDQKTLSLIVSLLLIEYDSELIIAAFDFLYQYILPGNQRIEQLFKDPKRVSIFTAVLPKLLSYNINGPDYSLLSKTEIKLIKRLRPPAPKEAPPIGKELFEKLLELNEPTRSTAWLRCCFEPVEDSEFTQIALWRAYESKFSPPVRESGRKLLPAVEFIKNVSNAFNDASAMVITDSSTGKKKFVIKGIQPRPRPLSIEEGEIASKNTILGLQSKFIDDPKKIREASQEPLPEVKFPTSLSEVSKSASTFLCLISNDSKGPGMEVCKIVKPVVLHALSDIPPLTAALSEYMDNTPSI